MADKHAGEPPKETTGDHAHTLVRAGLGAIPFAGAAAIELFSKVITPPLERRRDRWREMVGERLQILEDAGAFDVESLQQNEAFVTVLMQASQAALRNHDEEKLRALRNGVLNAALPHPLNESLEQMFVNLLDEFTVWHLRLLHLFQNPVKWFETNNIQAPTFALSSSLSRLITAAYPELGQRGDLWELIANELNAKGLFSGGGLHTMMSADGAFQKRTTELGDQFIRFITEPKIEKDG